RHGQPVHGPGAVRAAARPGDARDAVVARRPARRRRLRDDLSSLRPPYEGGDSGGTATPTVTAVIKVDSSVILDLHFYFLNFDDFPCGQTAFGATTFKASDARSASFFQ